jgi:hypothetical protein
MNVEPGEGAMGSLLLASTGRVAAKWVAQGMRELLGEELSIKRI